MFAIIIIIATTIGFVIAITDVIPSLLDAFLVISLATIALIACNVIGIISIITPITFTIAILIVSTSFALIVISSVTIIMITIVVVKIPNVTVTIIASIAMSTAIHIAIFAFHSSIATDLIIVPMQGLVAAPCSRGGGGSMKSVKDRTKPLAVTMCGFA
jgi:hypothetical protein